MSEQSEYIYKLPSSHDNIINFLVEQYDNPSEESDAKLITINIDKWLSDDKTSVSESDAYEILFHINDQIANAYSKLRRDIDRIFVIKNNEMIPFEFMTLKDLFWNNDCRKLFVRWWKDK